jgi:hypothetical protein
MKKTITILKSVHTNIMFLSLFTLNKFAFLQPDNICFTTTKSMKN